MNQNPNISIVYRWIIIRWKPPFREKQNKNNNNRKKRKRWLCHRSTAPRSGRLIHSWQYRLPFSDEIITTIRTNKPSEKSIIIGHHSNRMAHSQYELFIASQLKLSPPDIIIKWAGGGPEGNSTIDVYCYIITNCFFLSLGSILLIYFSTFVTIFAFTVY